MAIISKKTVFYWNLVLKSIFAIILIYFLYRQLVLTDDLALSWIHLLDHLDNSMAIFIFACLALMPLNWSFESKKWQLLVRPFEKISFYRSFKAILSGISVALLTPNRVGEYAGRMLMVEAKNNWKAVISTVISSYAQNIWNIGLGLLAAMLLLHQRGDLSGYLFSSALVVSSFFLALLLFLYFNIGLTINILQRFKRYRLVEKSLYHLKLLETYSSKILLQVLLLALVRYLVYFLQYYLILQYFGLDISIVTGFVGIASIFLVQTSLPLPPVLGFLARGEIALLVWANHEFNELSILASSYILWFLNLIIPSIAGAAIIFTSNLSRTLGLSRNYFK